MTVPVPDIAILPYSQLVGQRQLRLALELSYVDPGIGVLASGERGTAKSTTIRAFGMMAFGVLPVTLPIGATEDRLIGGLNVEALLLNKEKWQPGLMEQASESAGRMLYVDEVNLLDDHLVNILLDAASTGVLVVQRDNIDRVPLPVRFTLVGTMNPEEGGLRPQLLDRFGLAVAVASEDDDESRRKIVETVLRFEDEQDNPNSEWLAKARQKDAATRARLAAARAHRSRLPITETIANACARLAGAFNLVGHRGDLVLIRSARARAALLGAQSIELGHLRRVAPLALAHRRPLLESGTLRPWTPGDDGRVDEALGKVAAD
ncbi:AAA family ATPase [Actinoplanes hulinensis]|uniref:AAA family ATPase n=1 Tax=Actinoplanes hulinensis TaxID=1144547 RepID=A0ABS7AY57_9ACTN|nr:AAA family ATPase [Actinoplanes hulinensis]MBW6433557.1 AAA family ATPase [Actinoplanes hulinensis]